MKYHKFCYVLGLLFENLLRALNSTIYIWLEPQVWLKVGVKTPREIDRKYYLLASWMSSLRTNYFLPLTWRMHKQDQQRDVPRVLMTILVNICHRKETNDNSFNIIDKVQSNRGNHSRVDGMESSSKENICWRSHCCETRHHVDSSLFAVEMQLVTSSVQKTSVCLSYGT